MQGLFFALFELPQFGMNVTTLLVPLFAPQFVSGQTVASIATFGVAYMAVIIVEPLADLGVPAAAKALRQMKNNPIVERRLFNPALCPAGQAEASRRYFLSHGAVSSIFR
ncbi:hypothetical protein MycrhDRAFT_1175 [Mycolicibacterium rhodesiae JS60]|nr:hypothetical protein MycrhDRAFT_1175 [Mycolicibacterium rhodesiae JS60]